MTTCLLLLLLCWFAHVFAGAVSMRPSRFTRYRTTNIHPASSSSSSDDVCCKLFSGRLACLRVVLLLLRCLLRQWRFAIVMYDRRSTPKPHRDTPTVYGRRLRPAHTISDQNVARFSVIYIVDKVKLNTQLNAPTALAGCGKSIV